MNNKVIPAVLLVGVILVFMFSQTQMGIFSPGFEGAKCYGYGADFRFNSDWDGTYQLHKYQDAEYPLVEHEAYGCTDKIFWSTVGTPNDAGIAWHYHHAIRGDEFKPDLMVHVESNIQLEDINRQGDPLGWNIANPTSGQRIEYWSKTTVKEETEDRIYYHYELKKESFIVAPAEFWVGFYLIPSQSNAGTASKWREGEYTNIVDWLMLDWTVWDNAYEDPWLDDPEVNVFDTPHDGVVLNEQKTWEYRGGFPIAGFIKEWEKAGWTSAPTYQESPQWYETRGKESLTYTIEELADLRDKLMAKCSFAPSLVGQFISLYNEPSASFDYEGDMYQGGYANVDYEDENNPVVASVRTPDSDMKKTMYFPINILNFGTYAEGDPVYGYRVFYPSCYFRIRMLYGVYGDFTYLWTEELAKDPTVDYPEEPEHHGTTVIHTSGVASWFTGVTGWLDNILQWMLSIAVIMVAAVIIISVIQRKKGGDET